MSLFLELECTQLVLQLSSGYTRQSQLIKFLTMAFPMTLVHSGASILAVCQYGGRYSLKDRLVGRTTNTDIKDSEKVSTDLSSMSKEGTLYPLFSSKSYR